MWPKLTEFQECIDDYDLTELPARGKSTLGVIKVVKVESIQIKIRFS